MSDPNWIEEDNWHNPIKSLSRRPFLGEIIFPDNEYSVSGADAYNKLALFYSHKRDDTDALDKLDFFMSSGDHRLLLIEGSVGIGKTWFIRHSTQIRKHDYSGRCAVIDMIRSDASNPGKTIYRRIHSILDRFFIAVGTSTTAMIRLSGEIRYRTANGINPEDVLTDRQKHELTEEIEQLKSDINGNDDLSADLKLGLLEHLPAEESGVLPNLFIVLDNLDRLDLDQQNKVIEASIRILSNSRVRLILPLRDTSKFLVNQYSSLSQYTPLRCRLGKLKVADVIQPRFEVHQDGRYFGDSDKVVDGNDTFTFPNLFNYIRTGKGFVVIDSIGRVNLRRMIDCLDRLLTSNHLLGLRNIGNIEKTVQSLMLAEGKREDETSAIIDLFRPPNEHRRTRASLCMFRVSERAYHRDELSFEDQEHTDFFSALGYSGKHIFESVVNLVGAGVLESSAGDDVESLRKHRSLKNAGDMRVTPLGKLYHESLLDTEWYYNGIRRSLAHWAPIDYVHRDRANQYPYMTPSTLHGYLIDAEETEQVSLAKWENTESRAISGENKLSAPSQKYRKVQKRIGRAIKW